jgi:hypothetical protein
MCSTLHAALWKENTLEQHRIALFHCKKKKGITNKKKRKKIP